MYKLGNNLEGTVTSLSLQTESDPGSLRTGESVGRNGNGKEKGRKRQTHKDTKTARQQLIQSRELPVVETFGRKRLELFERNLKGPCRILADP